MLEVKNLQVKAEGKDILRGIDLTVNAGEVHAIMGPNGSGKSTLAQVLAGKPAYEVTGGSVVYNGQDLMELQPEERAQQGVFLAFQYPVEIPGVSNAYFLRAAFNEIRKAHGEEEVDPLELADLMEERLKVVDMSPDMLRTAIRPWLDGVDDGPLSERLEEGKSIRQEFAEFNRGLPEGRRLEPIGPFPPPEEWGEPREVDVYAAPA